MISWKQLVSIGNKAKADGGFSRLVDACNQLVSERGQANLYALATAVVEGWQEQSRERHHAIFSVLATEFDADAHAVKSAANA
jgi:malonyl-CoA decarboxylase